MGFVRCTSYSNSYKHNLRFILIPIWIHINGYSREKALGVGLGKMFQTTYGSVMGAWQTRVFSDSFIFVFWVERDRWHYKKLLTLYVFYNVLMTLYVFYNVLCVLQSTYVLVRLLVEQEGAWEKWLPGHKEFMKVAESPKIVFWRGLCQGMPEESVRN